MRAARIAATGMDVQSMRLEASARNAARTGGRVAQHEEVRVVDNPGAGVRGVVEKRDGETDVAEETVTRATVRAFYRANASVVKAQGDALGTMIDVFV